MAKPPVKEIRFGPVKATIWANTTKAGFRRFTVSLVRIYKDGSVWRESKLYDKELLPLVAKAADHAHTWIYEQGQHGRDETADQQ